MANAFTRPYLDACVYITALAGPGTAPENQVELAAEILYLAERGEYQMFASTFIEAEVIKAPGKPPLSADQEALIASYFNRDCFVWIEVDRPLAQKARQLARQESLKPPDAVHVASALRAECDQMLTWDDKLNGNGSGRTIEGLYICEPHLAGRQASLIPAPQPGEQ